MSHETGAVSHGGGPPSGVSLREVRLGSPGSPGEAPELAVRLARPAADGSPLRGYLLYLHGFRSSQSGEKAAYFRRRWLEAGWAFCSYDARGHGDSAGDLADARPSANLEDLSRVRRWLGRQGGEEVVLVGSSMGAATCLWYAALSSRQGSGEAPAGGPAEGSAWRPRPGDGRVRAVLCIAPALSLAERLEAWAGPEGLEAWRREGTRRWVDDMGEAELTWDLLEDLRRYRSEELIARHRVPALLLQGRRDAQVGWQGAVELATRAREGTVDLHLFGDGDHRLIGHRERLWRLMGSFLEARGLA